MIKRLTLTNDHLKLIPFFYINTNDGNDVNINTEYGFYRVAVTNAGKRVVTGDNNATDYKTLTKEVYQLYLDGQELSENIVTGLKYYFIPSIEEIYDANQENYLVAALRDSLTANVVYSNAQYKAIYEEVLTWIKNNIDYAIQEAELDKE